MSIICREVSQGPKASAFDLRMFPRVPDAFSYLRSVSCMMGMSAGDVTKIVTSSA
jgi:hypothetical protein